MSIEFRWVHDAALVWLTLTDPALWPWVAYDDAQPDDFVPQTVPLEDGEEES